MTNIINNKYDIAYRLSKSADIIDFLIALREIQDVNIEASFLYDDIRNIITNNKDCNTITLCEDPRKNVSVITFDNQNLHNQIKTLAKQKCKIHHLKFPKLN